MLNTDLIVGSCTLVLAGLAYWVTRDLSHFGGIFVDFTLWAMLVLSLLQLAKGFIKPEKVTFFDTSDERNNVLVGLGILGGYLTLLPFVGFLPSSLLFFAVMNLYLSPERLTRRSIVQSVLLSVGVVAVFYVVFKHGLSVPLPKGSLFAD